MIGRNYDTILEQLSIGQVFITEDEKKNINQYVDQVLSQPQLNIYDVPHLNKIIKICNIIYNNVPNVLSPLDDNKYDRLIGMYIQQGIKYPIGAPPIPLITNITPIESSIMDTSNSGLKQVLSFVEKKDDMLFFDDLSRNRYPVAGDYIIDKGDQNIIFKKERASNHKYNLCGTLSKCKYTLCYEAEEEKTIDLPGIIIFERDYLQKYIRQGYLFLFLLNMMVYL